MGYNEALADGIQRVYDAEIGRGGKKGTYVYLVPCEICGTVTKKRVYRRDLINTCDKCKATLKARQTEKKKIDSKLLQVETKHEQRFNKAVSKIKKQVKDFSSYTNAINIAKTSLEKYDSIPESMVAIELIHLKYKIIPQQKVGKYRVDFAIPKEKIVIEVDGSVYHKDIYKGDREATIQFSLGMDWKIIHIPAEMIENDITKLKDIIDVFYKS